MLDSLKVTTGSVLRKLSNGLKGRTGAFSKFEVSGVVERLDDFPQTGYLYVKWSLEEESRTSGKTSLKEVRGDSVDWHQKFQFEATIRLKEDEETLRDKLLKFEVRKEMRESYTKIGVAVMNLSEFTDTRTMEGKMRSVKLLLADANVNSTLRVSVCMKHVGGTPFFKTPESAFSPRTVAFDDDTEAVAATATRLVMMIEAPSVPLREIMAPDSPDPPADLLESKDLRSSDFKSTEELQLEFQTHELLSPMEDPYFKSSQLAEKLKARGVEKKSHRKHAPGSTDSTGSSSSVRSSPMAVEPITTDRDSAIDVIDELIASCKPEESSLGLSRQSSKD